MPSGKPKICSHNKPRSLCKYCGGGSLCKHDKKRTICKECKGGSYCKHNRIRYVCKECKGKGICKHNKQKSNCKDCKGINICNHNRIKSTCKECKGSNFCEHNKRKSICKNCNGKSICEHNKNKFFCKLCNGNGICIHKKIKYQCNKCNIDTYLKSRSRILIYDAYKRTKTNKSKKTFDIIGLKPDLFKKWIEYNLNIDNINNNFHIDHFIPLSKYKFDTENDIIESKINHWTNLRPIDSRENLIKYNKIPNEKEKKDFYKRIDFFSKKYLN